MDLISWSLNAIDTIFSSRKHGLGEPTCPDGMFVAGYTMDGWERWRVVCLAALSVEDVEDIYLFGFLITGLLALALGTGLVFRKLCKTEAAVQRPTKLLELIDTLGKALTGQQVNTLRIMDNNNNAYIRNNNALAGTLEKILERISALEKLTSDYRQ